MGSVRLLRGGMRYDRRSGLYLPRRRGLVVPGPDLHPMPGIVASQQMMGAGELPGLPLFSKQGLLATVNNAHVVGQTYTITTTFEPKLLVLSSGPETGGNPGQAAALMDLIGSIGFATSSAQCCIAFQDDHAAATSSADSADFDDRIWTELSISGLTNLGAIAVDDWTWNGTAGSIVLIVTQDIGGANRSPHYWVLGGDMSASLTSHTEPASAAPHDITIGVEQPKLLLFASAGNSGAINTSKAHATMCLGMCDGDLNQAVVAIGSEDGLPTASDTGKYAKLGQCLAMMPGDPNSVDWRDSVIEINGNVVSFAGTERASSRRYWVAAINQISAKIASMTVAAGVGTQGTLATTFRPLTGLFMTSWGPEDADNAPSSELIFSMGHYGHNSLSSSMCWGVRSRDNVATQSCTAVLHNGDNVLSGPNPGGASIDGEIDVATLTDTGVDLNNTVAPATTVLAIGALLGDG